MRDAGTLIVAGAGLGWALAALLNRLLVSLLFGVGPADPVTYVSVTLVLAGAAALASYLPARRAGQVDPLVAIRDQT